MLVQVAPSRTLEAVRKAQAIDAEAARLWVHMGLWETLGELIDEARPEIDAVFRKHLHDRNVDIRRELVRTYVERRLDGAPVDDVLKAADHLNVVNVVAKAGELDVRDVDDYNRTKEGQAHPKDEHGRWSSNAATRSSAEHGAYDMTRALTQRNDQLRTGAESVRDQMRDPNTPYSQMRVIGNGLVASGHPNAQAVGVATRVAAEIGPSAEDVLGPGLRRIAYRYRGTEKRPDAQLVTQVQQASGLHHLAVAGSPEDRSRVARTIATAGPGEIVQGAVGHGLRQQGWTEDQQALGVTSDVATAHLINTRALPTMKELELSQAAGKTPPSVGVMIDRDGDVVSEAQGYSGDHFLPFDLKNLKRLHGGSYVRTRALGGPTSEDVYTGLLTGARQMRVVSRSGVFTVEFDPDLRGGRRYSDKARQMVDRYARLIDTVDSGTLMAQDIDPAKQREIRAKVLRVTNYDEEAAKPLIQRRLRAAREEAALGFDEEAIEEQATAEAKEWEKNQISAGRPTSPGAVARQKEAAYEALMDDAREKGRVRRLQLNGEGYARALESLKREFPYYIRDVRFETLPDFEKTRSAKTMDQPLSPRSAPAAGRSHIARGGILPRHQQTEYGRDAQGRRTKGKPAEEKPTDEAAATAAAGASGQTGAAPKRGVRLGEAIKEEAAQRKIRGSIDQVLKAGRTAPDQLKSATADVRDAKSVSDAMALTPVSFLEWMTAQHHNDAEKAAKWLTEDASPEAIERVTEAIDAIVESDPGSWTGGNYGDMYGPAKMREYRAAIELVGRARDPFVKVEGDPALHEPSDSRPRPAMFNDIPNSDNAKDYEEWANRQDESFQAALEWVGSKSPDQVGREVRSEAIEYKDALKFGEKIKGASEDQLEDMLTSETSVPPADAKEIAELKERSPQYMQLRARQRAYSYVYARNLADALHSAFGGGADPKVGKRAPRVQVHGPTDPLSVALAKRLRGSRPSGSGAMRRSSPR